MPEPARCGWSSVWEDRGGALPPAQDQLQTMSPAQLRSLEASLQEQKNGSAPPLTAVQRQRVKEFRSISAVKSDRTAIRLLPEARRPRWAAAAVAAVQVAGCGGGGVCGWRGVQVAVGRRGWRSVCAANVTKLALLSSTTGPSAVSASADRVVGFFVSCMGVHVRMPFSATLGS